MLYKTDLHAHIDLDAYDSIKYDYKTLLNYYKKKGFSIVTITCHDSFPITDEMKKFASINNMILIPGIEKTIEGKEILILNIQKNDIADIMQAKSFSDVATLKNKKHLFFIAPHPYHIISTCLKEDLEKNIEIFDAIEICSHNTLLFNPNKKARRIARKYNLPLVGTSDSHFLREINHTYTLIPSSKKISELSIGQITDIIKNGKALIVSNKLSLTEFLMVGVAHFVPDKYRQYFVPKLE